VAQWCAANGVRCGLAEFSGAARLASMVRYKRSAVYIREQRTRDVTWPLLRELQLKEVDTGPTLSLWITDDDSVFYNARVGDGAPVVSPLQLYLDLRHNPARGQEAADEVFHRYLEPAFRGVGADPR
jgi:hypothetical protein